MKYLVIYEHFPERTEIFELETEDFSVGQLLLQSHGRLANTEGITDEALTEFIMGIPTREDTKLVFDSAVEDSPPYETSAGVSLIWTGYAM